MAAPTSLSPNSCEAPALDWVTLDYYQLKSLADNRVCVEPSLSRNGVDKICRSFTVMFSIVPMHSGSVVIAKPRVARRRIGREDAV